MRLVAYIIAASIALAALKLAIQLVLIGALITFFVALITRPWEVLAWILMMMTYSAICQYPHIVIPALIVLALIRSRQDSSSGQSTQSDRNVAVSNPD